MKTSGALAVGVLVLALAGCATMPPAEPQAAAAPTVETAEPTQPVTFAAIGDSITVWSDNREGSWTTYAGSDDVTFSGEGWAEGGSGLEKMRDNTVPVTADVLVLLAGTNYIGGPMPFAERLVFQVETVQRSQAGSVVIAAVPPYNRFATEAVAWNDAMEQLASDMGWSFVNPWADLTNGDGTWVDGYSVDGIHPTPETAAIVGPIIGEAIEDAGRD